jgi:hypothetical protein
MALDQKHPKIARPHDEPQEWKQIRRPTMEALVSSAATSGMPQLQFRRSDDPIVWMHHVLPCRNAATRHWWSIEADVVVERSDDESPDYRSLSDSASLHGMSAAADVVLFVYFWSDRCHEWTYQSVRGLTDMRGPRGMHVELDLEFEPKPLSELEPPQAPAESGHPHTLLHGA